MLTSRKKITLKDIARMADVSAAAVSGVLNNSSKIKCGQEKRKKIFELAKKFDYTPDSRGRALVSGRTGYIGFLVAEMATLGLGNAFFAQQLAGMEVAAAERGYLVTVSACDLNNIGQFVFPDKLKPRTVDGLLVSGPIMPEVISTIKDIGIPAVICYEPKQVNAESSMQLRDNQFLLSFNNNVNILQGIDFFYNLGHRRICLSSLWDEIIPHMPEGVEFTNKLLDASCTFHQGMNLGIAWLEQNPAERFTALIGCDQFCYGFLRALNSADPNLCPKQVSVLCQNETVMNEFLFPAVSSFSSDPFMYGRIGGKILIDFLEKKCSAEEIVIQAKQFYMQKIHIIERESTGQAPLL